MLAPFSCPIPRSGVDLTRVNMTTTLHVSSASTRDQLLETAWRLFRSDPAAASMGRIAAEAGVSRQAVYLHFQSRAGLLLALVRWIDEREQIAAQLEVAASQPT